MVGASFLLTAFVCLFVSYVLSEVFLKLHYPRVIGQILTGVLLSFPFFSLLFSGSHATTLDFLSDLGIIFLMMLTGLSLNLRKMRSIEKDALLISFFSVVVPFALGLGVMRALNYAWVESLVVGACLSLTAEGTTMEVLYDLKAVRTKLGSVIIGAGILDDVFELFFVSALLIFLQHDTDGYNLFFKFIAFGVIIYLLFKILPLVLKVADKDHVEYSSFASVIVFGLLIASIAEEFSMSIVLAALIAGVILNYTEHKNKEYKKTVAQLELVAFSLLIPFFFIKMGLHFDFSSFLTNLPLVLLIIGVAVVGKLLGALITVPFTSLTLRQTHVVGWALNSRGMVELVIANFAFVHGLISVEVFSGLIAMAVLTTVLFPFILKYLAKDRHIWYE